MYVYINILIQESQSKIIEANKHPQTMKEEIPKLKPAEKRRTTKVRDKPFEIQNIAQNLMSQSACLY